MRNLFGQVDGTTNPGIGSEDMERIVWGHDSISPWIRNGTLVVIRRISMNLNKWDELDRSGREESVGRTLKNGAPLTGSHEHDEPDFAAVNLVGFPVRLSHLSACALPPVQVTAPFCSGPEPLPRNYSVLAGCLEVRSPGLSSRRPASSMPRIPRTAVRPNTARNACVVGPSLAMTDPPRPAMIAVESV